MVRIYELDQNSSEWDKLRLGKFTASDAQAIGNDGKGLETLVYKKVAEIMTQQIEESYMNSDMQRGHDFEAMARNAYEIETGKRVVQVGFVEMNSYVGCSPDGLVGEDGLAEYKNLNGANYIKALYSKTVDPGHMWQMQMQMLVTEREWVDYCICNFNFPSPIKIVRIHKSDSFIDRLKAGLDSGIKQVELILAELKRYS